MRPFIRFGRYKEGLYPRHALGRKIFQLGPGSAWNNMYRHDFLADEGILFQDLKCHNDSAFTDISLWKAGSVYLLKKTLVLYRHGLGTSIQDARWRYPFEALKAAEKIFDEAHGQPDLSPSEEVGMLIRCASLLSSSAESLIVTQSYDAPAHERLVGCLQHWGPLGTPRTSCELKVAIKAALINHATYDKVAWAHNRWRRKVRFHTPLEKLDYALRIAIAIALSNLPTNHNR